MTTNLSAVQVLPGTSAHETPVSASVARPTSNMAPSEATPRRMMAVTVALSEPMDASPELDWAATIAAVLRLTYRNTTVEVIDSWRVDQ